MFWGVAWLHQTKFPAFPLTWNIWSHLCGWSGQNFIVGPNDYTSIASIFIFQIVSDWTNVFIVTWLSYTKEELTYSLALDQINEVVRQLRPDLVSFIQYNVKIVVAELHVLYKGFWFFCVRDTHQQLSEIEPKIFLNVKMSFAGTNR